MPSTFTQIKNDYSKYQAGLNHFMSILLFEFDECSQATFGPQKSWERLRCQGNQHVTPS